jgi:preprotein translocase subunit SecF
MIPFTKYRKIYFLFSGILILGSLISFIIFGLNWGIEFTGGSLLKIEYKEKRPPIEEIRQTLSSLNLKESIQLVGEKGVMMRMADISEETRKEVLEKLGEKGSILEGKTSFESIGPVIGKDLKEKTRVMVILSLSAIVFYIAWAFRKISRPIASWQYGLVSLIALFHDLFIPIGIFSLLGAQITIPVVTALLTVLGYSINNTVVVFDRIRENLLKQRNLDFSQTVDFAINQTLSRQINTSLTTLFPLFFIFFLGGETLRYFALTLILGISAGTYSSIFLASPLLLSGPPTFWTFLKTFQRRT